MPDTSDNEVLDEGLSRLAGTGPEFRGGLSNHGPMAAEALVRLGRADAVERWLDNYLKKLDASPRPAGQVTDENWREALGALSRVADWEAYLRAQLAEEPWRDVLARWWPRLLPGVAAAATHGVIRTSHAARSLAAAEAIPTTAAAGASSPGAGTGPRRDELARGLAYWAASYLELSGTPRTGGHRDLQAAIGALPTGGLAPEGGLITTQLAARLPELPGFGDAVAGLRPPGDPAAALGGLAGMFAGVFLRYGRTRPIALLHAVTAPVAARSVLPLLPLLPPELARPTYDSLWQVAAGLYAVYAGGVTPEPLPAGPGPSPDEVTARAVAAGDEHAIKLTEACLRLHAQTPDPVLLHAAARASELLGGA
jgi:Questin oxidase-like